MIKFFRKIRYELMGQNKTGRYLKYAIGEILLVMIGILLALQVNNWNIDNQKKEKESYYLNSIKTSIELSQTELDRIIQNAAITASSADTLLTLISLQKQERLKGKFLDSLLFSASDYSLMSLNDGGIKEILNTGSLDIIKDKQIRVFLASWDEKIHKIRKYEEVSQALSDSYLAYIKHYVDKGRWILDSPSVVIPEKNNELLADPQLRNYLSDISEAHINMFKKYTDEKWSLDSLNFMIDQYLL